MTLHFYRNGSRVAIFELTKDQLIDKFVAWKAYCVNNTHENGRGFVWFSSMIHNTLVRIFINDAEATGGLSSSWEPIEFNDLVIALTPYF